MCKCQILWSPFNGFYWHGKCIKVRTSIDLQPFILIFCNAYPKSVKYFKGFHFQTWAVQAGGHVVFWWFESILSCEYCTTSFNLSNNKKNMLDHFFILSPWLPNAKLGWIGVCPIQIARLQCYRYCGFVWCWRPEKSVKQETALPHASGLYYNRVTSVAMIVIPIS